MSPCTLFLSDSKKWLNLNHIRYCASYVRDGTDVTTIHFGDGLHVTIAGRDRQALEFALADFVVEWDVGEDESGRPNLED